ncbi:dTDP-4-dehydrorhamnose reductase family protein [Nocardioides yefusunii]|uniref:dTDP-4-dehydrorhamnose reductase n=1 Tax=Nocardioides yefusunii TaxID=2500546 RepID=A0ABW1QTW1_9ACTN|nr:SDR family oxidoreductase [Nocardioides yefusunii]
MASETVLGSDVDLLVLGVTGMLGSALANELPGMTRRNVHGTARTLSRVPDSVRTALGGGDHLHELDVLDDAAVVALIEELKPRVVINAVGMVKQAPGLADQSMTVRLNALLPHLLAETVHEVGGRLIHVSTDCVFSGRKGGYQESDLPDPADFYGRSKLLGEVHDNALTLRTSIIGPEVARHGSLLDWFLGQDGNVVKGFRGAIYSGLTTFEFARFVAEHALPNDLTGLYQLSSTPISKYDLLGLVAQEYGWKGEIVPEDEFTCDRSMSGERLREAIGYAPPDWPTMIAQMHDAHIRWHGLPAGKESLA